MAIAAVSGRTIGRRGEAAGAAPARHARFRVPADWLERERTQWFNWLPVALGLGIAIYFSLPVEPSTGAVLAPLPAALLLWWLSPRGTIAAFLCGLTVAACTGLALAKWRSDSVASPMLERRIGPVEVRGVLELVEPRASRGERLTLRVRSTEGVEPAKLPFRVRIRTMTGSLPGAALQPGDAVRVRAHLAPPSGPSLPGGYDFARAAFFQQLGGIGYAMTRAERDPDAAGGGRSFAAALAQLRQRMSERIFAALPGQAGAIAAALITGERGAISAATNDAFRDSGLYHMLSISGLHMAVMGGAVFFAVRFGLALFPSVALRRPIKKWAAAAAIAASLGYLLLSGAAFATIRAAVTITIMFVAVLLDRPALAMRNVALSALIILVVWPESLVDVGFQMSFAAVVALVACYEALRRRLLPAARWPEGAVSKLALFFAGIVLSTLIASAAVAPFSAYYFHKAQQLAVIANVLATPLSNLVIMPAALVTLVVMPLGLEAWPLAIMGYGIDLTIAIAEWVAALPGAASRLPAMSQTALVMMITGGLWFMLWREAPRWLGLVVFVAGLAMAPLMARPDILVGHDGRLLAVRADGGRLAAIAGPQTSFDLARWLEFDGDERLPRAAAASPGFTCDATGCTARVNGYLVAYPKHASAIAEDCARADILVLQVPRPKGCTRPAAVIDFFDLRAKGTHAVYLAAARDGARNMGNGGAGPLPSTAVSAAPGNSGAGDAARAVNMTPPNITTVADWRGRRPWSPLPWWADRRRDGAPADARPASYYARTASGAGRATDLRLPAFAASPALMAAMRRAAQETSGTTDGTDDDLRDPSLYDDRW